MISQKATEPIAVPDSLAVTLKLMGVLATSVLNENINEAACVRCVEQRGHCPG